MDVITLTVALLCFVIGYGRPSSADCVSSCKGLPNGRYVFCSNRRVYVDCDYGRSADYHSCKPYQTFDSYLKRCEPEHENSTYNLSRHFLECLSTCHGRQNGKYSMCGYVTGSYYVECSDGVWYGRHCQYFEVWNSNTRTCEVPYYFPDRILNLITTTATGMMTAAGQKTTQGVKLGEHCTTDCACDDEFAECDENSGTCTCKDNFVDCDNRTCLLEQCIGGQCYCSDQCSAKKGFCDENVCKCNVTEYVNNHGMCAERVKLGENCTTDCACDDEFAQCDESSGTCTCRNNYVALDNRTCLLDVSERCLDGWVPFEGKCYYFLTEKRQYRHATEYCEEYGGMLAEPFTNSTNEFLKAVVRQYKTSSWWIGLNDIDVEGKWVWTKSGKSPSYSSWSSLEPNQGRTANCVILWHTIEFGWADEHCSIRKWSTICEI